MAAVPVLVFVCALVRRFVSQCSVHAACFLGSVDVNVFMYVNIHSVSFVLHLCIVFVRGLTDHVSANCKQVVSLDESYSFQANILVMATLTLMCLHSTQW